MHCAHAIDNASYSGSVSEVARYFVTYTQIAADAKATKEKFAALEANKDSILKTVL